MKTIALVAFMLATTLTAAEAPRSSEDVVTQFESPAILSGDQIRIVKELALRAGLPSVGRIYTYNIHPGPSYGIGALSEEEIKGRESTTSCILIGFEKWEPGGSKHQKVEFRSGDFWAYPWIDKTRFAKFSGPRGEKKISLSEKTSLAAADRIFALFETGKLRFKNPALKKKVDDWRTMEFSLTRITWEADGRGSLGIAVSDRHAAMSVDCVLEEGEIVVVEVYQVIS
jgi:hypothetical protein